MRIDLKAERQELHGAWSLLIGLLSLVPSFLLLSAFSRSSLLGPSAETWGTALLAGLPTLIAASWIVAWRPSSRWKMGLPFCVLISLSTWFFLELMLGLLSGQGDPNGPTYGGVGSLIGGVLGLLLVPQTATFLSRLWLPVLLTGSVLCLGGPPYWREVQQVRQRVRKGEAKRQDFVAEFRKTVRGEVLPQAEAAIARTRRSVPAFRWTLPGDLNTSQDVYVYGSLDGSSSPPDVPLEMGDLVKESGERWQWEQEQVQAGSPLASLLTFANLGGVMVSVLWPVSGEAPLTQKQYHGLLKANGFEEAFINCLKPQNGNWNYASGRLGGVRYNVQLFPLDPPTAPREKASNNILQCNIYDPTLNKPLEHLRKNFPW